MLHLDLTEYIVKTTTICYDSTTSFPLHILNPPHPFVKMKKYNCEFLQVLNAIAGLVNVINPKIKNHHERVACIALYIARDAGLSQTRCRNIFIAAMVHDIGALAEKNYTPASAFFEKPSDFHALLGAAVLGMEPMFSDIIGIVENHHIPWSRHQAQSDIPTDANLLFLAGWIEVFLERHHGHDVLDISTSCIASVLEKNNTHFNPQFVDAFLKVSEKEGFWLDATREDIYTVLQRISPIKNEFLALPEVYSISRFISYLIDMYSHFTMLHSTGVGAIAREIGTLLSYSEDKLTCIEIAGYIHDAGKLTVPSDILHKNGALTAEEFKIIKTHSYNTLRLLEGIEGLHEILSWGANHHEHLDGLGYPFRLKAEDIGQESRVLAVADIFTALAEDRPYRAGMPKEKVIAILRNEAKSNKIDTDIVELVIANIEKMYHVLNQVQQEKLLAVDNFCSQVEKARQQENNSNPAISS